MDAMQIRALGPVTAERELLALESVDVPEPAEGEVLIRVIACGVCHTELDEIEGRTPPVILPMTPGHQVVGSVVGEGPGCHLGLTGQRVGVAWIHSSCGTCQWCLDGRENLCPEFRATGRDAAGGYAQFMTAPEMFVHELPDAIEDLQATPLLCAGAVGYRALQLCRMVDGQRLGLTGFGASGHLVLQMARHLFPNSPLYIFARSADERAFARQLGAHWAGGTEAPPPHPLDAIIDTTPAWLPVLAALEALAPGGRLVVNAIRKEAGDRQRLAELDYDRHLWREKTLTTVANVTRNDVRQCLRLATVIPLRPEVSTYPLQRAGQALLELKQGNIRGAKVLQIG